VSMLVATAVVLGSAALAMAMVSEVQELDQVQILQDPAAGGGTENLASQANSKADLALSKISTAKELREKARAVLEKKGKPIPAILKKGALDDIHQRVVDAQKKLSGKFGGADAAAPMAAPAAPEPVVAPPVVDNSADLEAEATTAKANEHAEEKKAKMYKKQYQDEKKKGAEKGKAEGVMAKAAAQKSKLDKQLTDMQKDKRIEELETKLKEKAEERMEEKAEAPAESDADFNHRQIAQEAYNKQVMGYVMSWEKTHGGPQVPNKDEDKVKASLNQFVDHYESKHAAINSDISVADTPTR